MTRRSQNGWPVLTRDQTVVIRAGGGAFRVAPAVAVVMRHLVDRYVREVEPITGPVLDDWSWADRPVRGSTTIISNHASGTALDLNALEHPRGARRTFSAGQVAAIRRILAELPCIQWGGDFRTTPDEMHWEIDGTAAEVAAVTRRLQPPPPPPKEDPMPSAQDVWNVKYREYKDEDEDGVRDHRTAADILWSTHATTANLRDQIAQITGRLVGLESAIAELTELVRGHTTPPTG